MIIRNNGFKILSCFVMLSIVLSLLPLNIVFAVDEGYILDELGDKSKIVSSEYLDFKTFDTDKFGDYTRAVATTGTKPGYIIYRSDGCPKIEVTLYRNPHGGDLLFYTGSTANGEWTQIPESLISSAVIGAEGGWEKVLYTINNTSNEKFFRLQWYDPDLGPNLHTQGYHGIYNKDTFYYKSQIGAVVLYKDENAKVSDNIMVGNSLVKTFFDDFVNLNKWYISGNHSKMISAKKDEDKTCVVFDTEMAKFECMSADPYIKTKDFVSGYDTYEINLSVKTDSTSTERTLALKTSGDDGVYLYPISFGKEGTIGVRTGMNTFKDFDEPYSYYADRWYNIKIIINTKTAEETVYINNELVTQKSIVLIDGGATGGISEVRFSHIDRNMIGVKTYLDNLLICKGYSYGATQGISQAEIEKKTVQINDIYYHWSKPTVKNLIASGVIAGYEDGSFYPDNNINIDEFIKIVIDCNGYKLKESSDYINKALETGIIKDGEYSSYNVPIKRYQMASILARATYGEPAYQPQYDYTDEIMDFQDIPEEYKLCVLAAYSKGIMTGDQNGMFNPLSNATRAETACVVKRYLDPAARQYARYTVGVYAADEYMTAANDLIKTLENSEFCYKLLTKENMSEQDVLNADSIDCVVLLNNIEKDNKSAEVFRKYVEDGGDIVLAGKDIRHELSTTAFKIPLFGYASEIDAYHMKGISTIKASDESNQSIVPMNFEMQGSWNGETAIGYEHIFRSEAIPVLKAYDAYGRELGYAAGVLVNYGTSYAKSNMLYYGIDEKDFYESEGFRNSIAEVLKKFASGELDNIKSYEEEYKKHFDEVMNYEMTQPAPKGRVHVSEDGTHLVDGEGNLLFINGVNFFGDVSFGYNAYGRSYGQFSIEDAEASFKKMHELGINCIRFWRYPEQSYGGEYTRQVTKVIKDLCRKYGIYVQMNGNGGGSVVYDAYDVQGIKNNIDVVMELWAEEPMFIGYDLCNEPDLAKLIYQFGIYGDAPLDKYDVYSEYEDILTGPEFSSTWATFMNKTNSRMKTVAEIKSCTDNRYLQTAALFGLFLKNDERFVKGSNKLYNGHLVDVEWKASDDELFSKVLNEIMDNGLGAIRNHIKEWDPEALFTIGFDSAGCVIPAVLKNIDYLNQHVYRATDPPYPMSKTVTQFTGFDTMNSLSDKVPAIYGEYSPKLGTQYTFGSEDQQLSNETADAINLFTLIYPYSKGYGGGLAWMYEDWCSYTYNYESRGHAYGIERFSGNSDTDHRFLDRMYSHTLKFFKKFTDRDGTFKTGTMDWFQADTQCDTGLRFIADTAEYVYSDKYSDDRLAFEVGENDPRPVVMLDWGNGVLDVMATANVKATITLPDCLSGVTKDTIKLDGFYKSYTLNGNKLEIELLDNSTVTVSKAE